MKKDNLEDYYDFFMELPPTDYLKDIEIQDDYDKPNDFTVRGLSDEQVSQIALDSLRAAKQTKFKDKSHPKNSDHPSQN